MGKIIFIFLVIALIAVAGCSSSIKNYSLELRDCVDGKCKEGYVCEKDNKCHLCGNAPGRPCCEGKCEEGLLCRQGTCSECGTRSHFCCDGECNEGLKCINDICRGCGWVDEPCCEGKCSNDLVCKNNICKVQFQFSEDDTKELASATSSRG